MTIHKLAIDTLLLSAGNFLSVLIFRISNIKDALSEYKLSIRILLKYNAYANQKALDQITRSGGKLAIISTFTFAPLLVANYFVIVSSVSQIDYFTAITTSTIIFLIWLPKL